MSLQAPTRPAFRPHPTDTLRHIVDRDTNKRHGNGALPANPDDLPFRCSVCGEFADLCTGAPNYDAEDCGYWATDCCQGFYVDRLGSPYVGDSPYSGRDF